MSTRMLALIAALSASSVAMADSVSVRFLGRGEGREIRVSHGSNNFRVFAGQLRHELTDGTGLAAALSGEYRTYCAELTQYVTSSSRRYDLVPVSQLSTPMMGAARAGAIAGLFAYANGAQLEAAGADDFAAAFQIAVWEIIYDYDTTESGGSLDTDHGVFEARSRYGGSLSSEIRGYLNSFFAAALAPPASDWTVAGLTHEGKQDQMIGMPMTAVPLPGAGLAGLVGLGVIGARRRRG